MSPPLAALAPPPPHPALWEADGALLAEELGEDHRRHGAEMALLEQMHDQAMTMLADQGDQAAQNHRNTMAETGEKPAIQPSGEFLI
jgi:hypothetical protein